MAKAITSEFGEREVVFEIGFVRERAKMGTHIRFDEMCFCLDKKGCTTGSCLEALQKAFGREGGVNSLVVCFSIAQMKNINRMEFHSRCIYRV